MLTRRPLLAMAAAMPFAVHAARPTLHAFGHAVPPLSFERNGRPAGLAVDLLKEMSALAGVPIDFALQPRLRADRSFHETPDSLQFPLARLNERGHLYRWIGPVVQRRVAVYALASRTDIEWNGLKQLNGLHLGATTGSATLSRLIGEGLRPGKELEVSPTYDASVRKLLAGRMDLLVIGDLNMYWQLQLMHEVPERVREVAVIDASTDYCFGLHPGWDPGRADALQRALDQLRKDGAVERLKRDYGLPV